MMLSLQKILYYSGLRFALENASYVNVSIYNIMGAQVANLANEEYSEGMHELQFNRGNFATGVYFLNMSTVAIQHNDASEKIIKNYFN